MAEHGQSLTEPLDDGYTTLAEHGFLASGRSLPEHPPDPQLVFAWINFTI
jgi:hypothetical protein